MFNRTVLASVVLGAAALASAPAAAQNTTEVAIADLNLTTKAGRATLDRRLDAAVRKVCPASTGRVTLDTVLDRQACMAAARESYKEQYRLALDEANARRVAVLAEKLGFVALR